MERTGLAGPLTLEMYLMGRDSLYRDELTDEILKNAEILCSRVGELFKDLHVYNIRVSSGWRPLSINKRVGGAKGSLHMTGDAVDIHDIEGVLAGMIEKRSELLLKHGLWMENPEQTPTWVHLDQGIRTARNPRIFRA